MRHIFFLLFFVVKSFALTHPYNLKMGLIKGSLSEHITNQVLNIVKDKDPKNDTFYIASPANGWTTNSLHSPPWDSCFKNFTMFGDYKNDLYVNPTYALKNVPTVSAVSGVPSYGIIHLEDEYYVPNVTLITRRHAIRETHGSPGITSSSPYFFWFDINGEKHIRKGIDLQDDGLDQRVYLLDTELPETVFPVKIVPPTQISKTILNPNRQKFKAKTPIVISQWKQVTIFGMPVDAGWKTYLQCGGDSGSGRFYLIENELILGNFEWEYVTNLVGILNLRNNITNWPIMFDASFWD